MKKYFYFGLFGLFITEILKAYLLVPLPKSQELNSLSLVYFLHDKRWIFRIVFPFIMLFGVKEVFQKRIWIPLVSTLIVVFAIYFSESKLRADKMFFEATQLTFKSRNANRVDERSLVISVSNNGIAKAYPLQFLEFHHQVNDSVGNKALIITYCSVCRSGMVFEPYVDGRKEKFRLVGMNHFNSMYEDHSTGSWWIQENGECVAGPLKGTLLPEFPSRQLTIKKFFELFPHGLVLQGDNFFRSEYDTARTYETGKIKTGIERTDSVSWKEKSWVIGVEAYGYVRTYDWLQLKNEKAMVDPLGKKSIFLVMSIDQQSFLVASCGSFLNPQIENKNDTISLTENGITKRYDFSGNAISDSTKNLYVFPAKQEFLHSWENFHPTATRFHGKH